VEQMRPSSSSSGTESSCGLGLALIGNARRKI
jgi:hypothetical protein